MAKLHKQPQSHGDTERRSRLFPFLKLGRRASEQTNTREADVQTVRSSRPPVTIQQTLQALGPPPPTTTSPGSSSRGGNSETANLVDGSRPQDIAETNGRRPGLNSRVVGGRHQTTDRPEEAGSRRKQAENQGDQSRPRHELAHGLSSDTQRPSRGSEPTPPTPKPISSAREYFDFAVKIIRDKEVQGTIRILGVAGIATIGAVATIQNPAVLGAVTSIAEKVSDTIGQAVVGVASLLGFWAAYCFSSSRVVDEFGAWARESALGPVVPSPSEVEPAPPRRAHRKPQPSQRRLVN